MSATVLATLKVEREQSAAARAAAEVGVKLINHREFLQVEVELDWDVIRSSPSLHSIVARHLKEFDLPDGLVSVVAAHVGRCNCCGQRVSETDDGGYLCGCVAETWTDADRWREAS